MTEHTFTITVSGCTAEQAQQVISERIDHDEDYGFPYQISATDAKPRKPKFTVYDYAAHARNCVARNVTGPGTRCENPAAHGDVYVIEEGEDR